MFRKLWQLFASAILVLLAPAVVGEELVEQDLLYSRDTAERCEIGIWQSSEARALVFAEPESCPEELFWAPDADTVFYVAGDTLRAAIAYEPGSVKTVAPLPSLKFADYAERLRGRLSQEGLDTMASYTMEVALAGYTGDGTVFLHIQQWFPGDDPWNLRLERRSGDWTVVKDVACSKWDVECAFEFSGVDELGYDWRSDPRDVWTEGIRLNRYFVRDEYLGPEEEPSPAGPTRRAFSIDGKDVEMTVVASSSGHYDTMYTFGVVLSFPDGASLTVCDTQCSAMLAGRYLLARRFWGGTMELFDIADGRSMLGPLKTAQWIKAR